MHHGRADVDVREGRRVLVHVDPPGARSRTVDDVQQIGRDAWGVLQVTNLRRLNIRERYAGDGSGFHVGDRRDCGSLEVDLDRCLGGLDDVVQRFRRGVGGLCPVVGVRFQEVACGRVKTLHDVGSGTQHVRRHVRVRVIDHTTVRLDDSRIHRARDWAGDRREEVPVCDGAEIPEAHVQFDRVLVNDLERVVCVLHHSKLRGRGVREGEGVQVANHPGRGVRAVVGIRIVVQPGQPEVLLEDEAPGLVHHDCTIQAEPHDVRVEHVAIREVDVSPQDEGVVETIHRPALREDWDELRVSGPIVVHEALIHLLHDSPSRSREGHVRIERIRRLRLVEDERIR